MSRWNNEVGENLLLKNNKSGWDKQGASTFSQNKDTDWEECFPQGIFLSQYFHQGLNSVGLKSEVSKLQLN